MIAGPNGSGKTKLADQLRARDIDLGEYINPDDIAKNLVGSYEERSAAAQKIADERRDDAIRARRSFSFETVMSHPSKIEVLVRAKESGYFVQVFFVGTDDPRTNIERVALRVSQGGHDVPKERIIPRWKRAMALLPAAIRAADEAFVFDNSSAGSIATTPRLVFRRSVKNWALPQTELFSPIPDWVRKQVLDVLGIGPLVQKPSEYSRQRPVPASIHPLREIDQASSAKPQLEPRRVDLEQAILGSIIVNNENFHRLPDYLASYHFSEPVHQRTFELCTDLIRSGKVVTRDTLKDLLGSASVNEIGIDEYLDRLFRQGASLTNLKDNVRVVFNLFLRRTLIGICNQVSTIAAEAPMEMIPRELIEHAERGLFELAEEARYQRGPQSFSQSIRAAVDRMARVYMRDDHFTGIPTGFTDLDEMIGGLQPSKLIIIASRPGMERSVLATNIAYNVAKAWQGETETSGKVRTVSGGIVAYFSLHLSAEQIASDIISQQSGIPSHRLLLGDFNPPDFDRIRAVSLDIETIPLFIDDTGGITLVELAGNARRLLRQGGLNLIVIDYLQLLISNRSRSFFEATEDLNSASQLKALAEELNVPIIALSQLRTESNKPPEIKELDDDILNSCDVAMFVYREARWLQDRSPEPGSAEYNQWQVKLAAARNRAEVVLAKHRGGPTGIVHLRFDEFVLRFSNAEAPP
jgi:replicative DNA helicase